jgi:hypothetical protein
MSRGLGKVERAVLIKLTLVGGNITMRQLRHSIVELCGVDKGALSRAVRSLRRKGLIVAKGWLGPITRRSDWGSYATSVMLNR